MITLPTLATRYNFLASVLMLAAFFTASASQTVMAQEQAPGAKARSVAEAYIRAYESQNFDKLRSFYAEDVVFIDPTSFDTPQLAEDIHWHGPDAIIAGISNWGTARGKYRVNRTFVASGRVVFDAEMDVV